MILKQLPEDFVVNEIPGFFKGDGPFAIFLLKKRCYTTEEAVELIAKSLNINRKRLAYAGLKDKHAITEQFISISMIKKEKVDSLSLNNVSLEFVGYSAAPLSIGLLVGNYFEIVVRDLDKNQMVSKNNKFKNFFDEQRFSSNNVDIGRAIVKKDFKLACNLVLKGDGFYESKVDDFLAVNPNNYIGALTKINPKILLLFVHAYQSFIFNKTIEMLDFKDDIDVPLVGFGTEFHDTNDYINNIILSILAEEKISLRDFIIRSLPGLSCVGGFRKLYVFPENLKIGSLELDELNVGRFKLKLSFSLPKGAYATGVVKQLLS